MNIKSTVSNTVDSRARQFPGTAIVISRYMSLSAGIGNHMLSELMLEAISYPYSSTKMTKVKVDGARKIWNTWTHTTTKTIEIAISRFCKVDGLKIKRKSRINDRSGKPSGGLLCMATSPSFVSSKISGSRLVFRHYESFIPATGHLL